MKHISFDVLGPKISHELKIKFGGIFFADVMIQWFFFKALLPLIQTNKSFYNEILNKQKRIRIWKENWVRIDRFAKPHNLFLTWNKLG